MRTDQLGAAGRDFCLISQLFPGLGMQFPFPLQIEVCMAGAEILKMKHKRCLTGPEQRPAGIAEQSRAV